MVTRTALAALALLTLTACSGPGDNVETSAASATDKFAGLDTEVRTWREALLTERDDCAKAPADHACRAFEVACKGELGVSPEETSAGVTAKVVSAMTFESWDTARSEYRPGSAFAEFVNKSGVWTRTETTPVNLATCAAT